jgi:hypothetical protein
MEGQINDSVKNFATQNTIAMLTRKIMECKAEIEKLSTEIDVCDSTIMFLQNQREFQLTKTNTTTSFVKKTSDESSPVQPAHEESSVLNIPFKEQTENSVVPPMKRSDMIHEHETSKDIENNSGHLMRTKEYLAQSDFMNLIGPFIKKSERFFKSSDLYFEILNSGTKLSFDQKAFRRKLDYCVENGVLLGAKYANNRTLYFYGLSDWTINQAKNRIILTEHQPEDHYTNRIQKKGISLTNITWVNYETYKIKQKKRHQR